MNTEDLITALAQDTRPRAKPMWVLAWAILPALGVSLCFYGYALRPRVALLDALSSHFVQGKFLLAFGVIALFAGAMLRSARPGARPVGRAGFGALVLLVAGLWIYGAVTTPSGARVHGFMGATILPCIVSIPAISASLLAALLLALRAGAVTDPRRAGMLAGLVAGGLGTVIYATHCTEDNPMFYATWYTLGILITAAAGALLGPRLLRW